MRGVLAGVLLLAGGMSAVGCSGSRSQVVEAACGQCQFGMAGEGCDLAVRMGGRSWFVDGTGIDDHGDAHGPAGFCNAIRTARVRGEVVGDRFVVRSFELLDDREAH